mgnify:CR=1 FL=1
MSQIEHYLTIAKGGEGLYKEKGSKFIAHAFFAASEDEVKAIQENLRQQYHDARHHCYAYVIGPDRSLYRANDDGEPNHSAGDPILGQINSKNLTNTLVVVIRYFGGTKLGVSGLINAYKLAAEEALNNSKLITVSITNAAEIKYGYAATSEVMRLVDEFELKITDQTFEDQCYIKAEVKVGLIEEFKSKLQLLQDTGSEIEFDID